MRFLAHAVVNGNVPESMSFCVRPLGGYKSLGEQQFHLADKVLGQMVFMSGSEIIRLGTLSGDGFALSWTLTPAESG